MEIIKSFFIAFSTYSKIPVPQFEWKEDDMKYIFAFFPWVGIAVGLCVFVWSRICICFQIGTPAYLLISAAIPILITGGIHVDGYMDTMDAHHSYKTKEEKLEILTDSHIGAFSVIMLVLYYLVYLAAFSEIREKEEIAVVCVGFVLSRALSGIAAVTFKAAKKEDMLNDFTDIADKKSVLFMLVLEFILCAVFMMRLSFYTGLLTLAGAVFCFVYYRYRSYKEFGGITGDMAGCFVLICEMAIAFAGAVGSRF